MQSFDKWLRTECFKAPPKHAEDLARAAWNAAPEATGGERVIKEKAKLKPCPFCGHYIRDSIMQFGHEKDCFLRRVIDRDGFATGQEWNNAWNTRDDPPKRNL